MLTLSYNASLLRTLLEIILFLLVMAGLLFGSLLMTAGWSWRDPTSWLVTLIGACLFYWLLHAIYKNRPDRNSEQ